MIPGRRAEHLEGSACACRHVYRPSEAYIAGHARVVRHARAPDDACLLPGPLSCGVGARLVLVIFLLASRTLPSIRRLIWDAQTLSANIRIRCV